MIPGINVSQWQSGLDWEEIKASGVKFAFIKATEFPDKQTTLSIDYQFIANIQGVKDNELFWGARHTFRTHIAPVIQAQMFCETVGEFDSLPPIVDINQAGAKGERLNYKVRLFLDEVEKLSSRRPVIGTNDGFWRSHLAYEKQAHTDWAHAYPLWISQYTTLWPNLVYPWAAWDFWTYSDKGRLPGIKTDVELTWFSGSEEELVQNFTLPINKSLIYVFEDEEYGEIPVFARKKRPELSFNLSNEDPGRRAEGIGQTGLEKGFTPIEIPASPKYSSNQENWIREYFF